MYANVKQADREGYRDHDLPESVGECARRGERQHNAVDDQRALTRRQLRRRSVRDGQKLDQAVDEAFARQGHSMNGCPG